MYRNQRKISRSHTPPPPQVEAIGRDLLRSSAVLTRRRFIQAGLTVALGSILTGYGGYRLSASLQGTREALAALRASRIPLAPLAGYREFRGGIHAHTRPSHDSHATP